MIVAGVVLVVAPRDPITWAAGWGLIPAGAHLLLSYYLRFETGIFGLLALGVATVMPYLAYTGALDPNEVHQRAIPHAVLAGLDMVVIRYTFALRAMENRSQSPVPRHGGDQAFWTVAVIAVVYVVLTA